MYPDIGLAAKKYQVKEQLQMGSKSNLSEGVDLFFRFGQFRLPLISLPFLFGRRQAAEVAGDDGVGGRGQVGIRARHVGGVRN